MILVNNLGQIIGELGIQWNNYSTDPTLWWSYDPHGYRIENQTKYPLWRLFRPSGRYGVADHTIFVGHSVSECMRAAEIYEVKRVL